ncbi:MAG: PadR family transcriptional regulator [Solirubrobacteraceae bacterium]
MTDVHGHLDGMLLAILGAGALHGYGVVQQLRTRSEGTFDLPEGSVYPALHRLERAGLLRSRWEVSGGRRRRVYSLSPKGRHASADALDRWKSFRRAVDGVLGVEAGR